MKDYQDFEQKTREHFEKLLGMFLKSDSIEIVYSKVQ